MEPANTKIDSKPHVTAAGLDIDADATVEKRLEMLLSANLESTRLRGDSLTEKEAFEAEMFVDPIGVDRAIGYFGLLIGTFTPAAMIIRTLQDVRSFDGSDIGILVLAVLINGLTAVAGYFSGLFIGRIVKSVERFRWSTMLPLLPLLGFFWGGVSGGTGGLLGFVVGAFVGAVIGGIVGSVALPAFVVFHRLLQRGSQIELKHFLPLAFGITFTICAFILGL